jgi:hypothetical protein
MTEEENEHDDWRTTEEKASDIAQAKALRTQASKAGLRFEVYLPSGLAEWVLDFVERGVFTDPGEAVFVILGEHKDLEPHADLREESLRRALKAAMDDPRPRISAEEFRARMDRLWSEPRPEPALWQQRKHT